LQEICEKVLTREGGAVVSFAQMAGKDKDSGKNVLFVCTGNTCRSPMAEGLFRKALGTRRGWTVRSAGVAASVGSKESRDTAKVLEKRGASLTSFRSQQVSRALIEQADTVFAMTCSHLAVLEDEFPDFIDKFYLAGDFAEDGGDVPDPFGMGAKAYEEVALVLEEAFPGIIRFLEAGE
jgi:protein-tyrosine-phosphatase